MQLFSRDQLKLLFVFYKSTLTLSVASSVMFAGMSFLHPVFMIPAFGACFLSAGSAITLLYKETSKQNEYYFYYNKSIPKTALILTCIIGNIIIGLLFISIYIYVQHP